MSAALKSKKEKKRKKTAIWPFDQNCLIRVKSDREWQILYEITNIWNLIKWYNRTYETKTDAEISKLISCIPKDKCGGGGKLRGCDWHIHTIIQKIDG